MKTSKKLNKLIALAVLLGGVTCMHSAWAEVRGYGNLENNVITITGSKSEEGKTNTYSTTNYVGVDGSNGNLGSNISSIVTASGGVNDTVYGIKVINSNSITATSIINGINVKSTGGDSFAISLEGTGTTTITGLGSITAETTSTTADRKSAYGIYASNANTDNTKKFSVAFDSTNGGSIFAYSAKGKNYGIMFDNADKSATQEVEPTGTSEVLNVKSITAGITKNEQQQEVIGEGAAYGVRAKDGVNTVTFTGADSSITAKSSGGNAFGIQLEAGTNTVSNLRSVSVVTNVSDNGEYGAEGVYLWDEGINTVTFTGADSSIAVTATGTSAKAYGIDLEENGQNTVSGLGSITAKTNGNKVAYGIRLYNQNDAGGSIPEFLVEFATDEQKTIGGSIDVYSQTGENYGIKFDTDSTGTSEVKNVKTITAGVSGNNVTVGTPYGIYAAAGVNTVTFTGADSSVTAKSNMYYVYGLYLSGGTNTISDIGSIKTNSTGSAMAYGIYTTGGKNTISFKGNNETPAQAITAKGSDALTSCSIETTGGSTTVNFENSILSGKVKQSGDSTLTLNFDNGGVWTPTASDVTGNVNVNVNAGGTIDTRATTTATKTINLGTGIFTATTKNEGETTIYPLISFDAWAKSDNTLVIDQVTAAAANGTIKLGTVNVKDEATAAWTTAKEANLISVTANLITITGEAKTETSQGWLYTFKGGANGKVSVTSELASHTLPQIIQGSDAAAQYTNTYSLTANEALAKDLGTLDNSERTSGLTIYGNSKTISIGTATNGTVTLAQAADILTLQDVTVSGFTKFADNAGTLNLSGVTFTGTTGADVITGTGKTVISGVVTADKNIAQQVELQNGANLTATSISVDSTGKVNGIYVNMANASDTASASVGTVMTTSTGDLAYGIYAEGTGTTTVKNLGSITAETTGANGKTAYGIYAKNENTDNTKQFSVSFDSTNGGTISAYSASSTNYGINFDTGSTGTSEVKNVKTITVGVKSGSTDSSDNSYGIYAAAGVNNVTFIGADSSITAKSSGSIAYGIFLTGGSGATVADYTISNLGSITMEATRTSSGAKAYGIHVQNKNAPGEESAPATFSVSLVDAGGSISAYSANGVSRGISFDNNCTGTSEVKNVKTITAGVKSGSTDSSGAAYGIYAVAGVNNVTFIGADSSITAKSSGNEAYGINLAGTGTNTISGLGSITVKTTATDKNAYGIRSNGTADTLTNNVSFKGNGGQAITATNTANSANAYSIYAKGGTGTTTVNFENSILSGKVHQEGTATLNLNFNDKGIWRPKADDVTGTVAVTVNNGGSIDTRTYDAQGKVTTAAVKTVDLKDCTLTFADGAKINADAVVTNDGVTMDNFTVKAASGTISLADLNINDSAVTTAWTGVKEVDLLTGDCSNVTFTQSVVESTNYTYIFTLGSASAQKLTLNVAIEETDLSSVVSGGSDKTSYKLKKDEEVLKKDLGTLDNSKRESFTIEGDGKTLVANGYKGVTITKDTDKMYVNNITVKGFDTFATVNAGELILKDVSFTDSGTADVVNNSAHTVIIDGTVTLDKGIAGEGRVVQKEGSTLEVDVTNPSDNAYINASKLDIENNTTISLKGAKEWGYYKLISGDAAKDGNIKLWDNVVVDLKTEGFRHDYDLKDGVITMEFRNIPLGVEANTSALAGVQQGAITMVNQIADTIGENVGIIARPAQEGVYDKTIWANYINSKETVNGMSMWRGTGDNTAKYHGVTVGADFYTTKKAIAGVALTYVTGDITSNPDNTHINNKTKYYGISFYDRVTNGKGAWTYDLGYSQGKNEISQNSYQTVTADAKTNAYTLGAKYEYAYNFEHSALVPFAGVRYLRLNSNDYSNSNGFNTSVNNQNIFQPKLGVAWRGDFKMGENGWSFKPVAEVGYLWNLGGTQADGTFTTVNRSYNIEYDTADRSTFYGKLGMNFQNKHFTGGVFYRYAKGSSVKNNRWNVNLSWSF